MTGVQTCALPISGEIRYTQTRTVPHYAGWLEQQRVITPDSTAACVDAYKILRTRVSQRMRQNGWRTLAVTSARPQEGKTLTAINLSISLAMESDHTVLLVDADLRRPSIHRYLGLQVDLGLSDHLLENIPLEQILIHPAIRHLVIAPGASQAVRQSSELLASPRMRQLVHELKTRYASRLVIFDLPPVFSTDDTLAFSPYIDALLLVVEEGKTQRQDVAEAVEILKSTNQNLLGIVLNKSAESNERYGYY